MSPDDPTSVTFVASWFEGHGHGHGHARFGRGALVGLGVAARGLTGL